MNKNARAGAADAACPDETDHANQALGGDVPRLRKPKPNKLFFKHRWLLSRDIVASLARAGVDCNIILPQPAGLKH